MVTIFNRLAIFIALIGLGLVVSGQVSLTPSSLLTAGRNHSCPGEILLFSCESNGTYLDWRFDTIYRARFFSDQSVDEVQTVSGRGFSMRAILTGNQALPGTSSIRRLNSVLIFQLFEVNTLLHNITCSSSAVDTEVVPFQTAGSYKCNASSS